MEEICLFIKGKTLDGKRDQVRALWEQDLKQRVQDNPDQKTYFYCYDQQDPNVICMFEHYSKSASLQENAAQDWFQHYMEAVSPLLAEMPEVHMTRPVWMKRA